MGTPNVAEIHRRIDDAEALWQLGRRESAFILALVAVAAAARRSYPALKERAAFEAYLLSHRRWRFEAEYQGSLLAIETILYKLLRCQLIHEAGMASDVQFFDEAGDELAIRAGGAPEYVLKVAPGWFHHLVEPPRVS